MDVTLKVLEAKRSDIASQDKLQMLEGSHLESNIRIYKTTVRPVLKYAVETRAESSKTKSLQRTTDMKILRAIKGVTLRDQVKGSSIMLKEDGMRVGLLRHKRLNEQNKQDIV
ncbi:hypothetical protein FQA39_LY15333 [Lamprigera yunnana]|nr:hypothetical protein FQA39_LY15333 [Lamprigera yunnana]